MQKDIEEKVFSKNYLKISDLIYVCIYFYFGFIRAQDFTLPWSLHLRRKRAQTKEVIVNRVTQIGNAGD